MSVATVLIIQGYSHRHEFSWWIQAAAILLSTALLLGYLTPIAASLSALLHLLVWYGLAAIAAPGVVVACLDALALALLGPGAYSVDSYRFGRRVVVLRPPP